MMTISSTAQIALIDAPSHILPIAWIAVPADEPRSLTAAIVNARIRTIWACEKSLPYNAMIGAAMPVMRMAAGTTVIEMALCETSMLLAKLAVLSRCSDDMIG